MRNLGKIEPADDDDDDAVEEVNYRSLKNSGFQQAL